MNIISFYDLGRALTLKWMLRIISNEHPDIFTRTASEENDKLQNLIESELRKLEKTK